MPKSAYSSAAQKTMNSFKKTYGSSWKRPYYALANKRTGGFRGTNRGAKAANISFAKGSHWKGNKSSGGITRRSRRRVR